MKCEICGKDILKDSQCIDYKYYHNDCIINLIKENQKYKEVIDKAIKYLDSFSFKNKPYYIPLNKYQDYQELLEILRGGINE